METRLTKLLGIKHPIVQGAMNYISLPPLVAAVSNAGGLGILCLMSLTPEEARESIREVKKLTDKPFGVNIVRLSPYYRAYPRIILEEHVPVLSHGVGDPFAALGMKEKPPGIIFMPTIGTVKQAIAAEKLGADALIATGAEAGGHVGSIPSTVLIPEVVGAVDIPVVAGGGYCDGKGLVSALVLGAEGINVGTRFAATVESSLHPRSKQALLEAGCKDVTVTSVHDGFRLSCIEGKKVRNYGGWWTRPWEVLPALLDAKKESKLTLRDFLGSLKQMRRDKIALFQWIVGSRKLVRGCSDGDVDGGLIPAGKVVGRIQEIVSCREVVDKIMNEAEEIVREMGARAQKDKQCALPS